MAKWKCLKGAYYKYTKTKKKCKVWRNDIIRAASRQFKYFFFTHFVIAFTYNHPHPHNVIVLNQGKTLQYIESKSLILQMRSQGPGKYPDLLNGTEIVADLGRKCKFPKFPMGCVYYKWSLSAFHRIKVSEGSLRGT